MEAQDLIDESVAVVGQMKRDEGFQDVLQQAKGIYIVPEYGKGAAIVGGDREFAACSKQDGEWSDPAFYNFGGVALAPRPVEKPERWLSSS